MPDRSQAFISLVEVAIALGILVWATRAISTKLRIELPRASDLARWFRVGWAPFRPLLLPLGVVLVLSVAGDFVRTQRYLKSQFSESRVDHSSVAQRFRMATRPWAIRSSITSAWRKLEPFHDSWVLAFWPILLTCAQRRRFPFSRNRRVAFRWIALGLALVALWAWPFFSTPREVKGPTPTVLLAFSSLLWAAYSVVGLPSLVLLLMADLDDRTQRSLDETPARPRIILTRLVWLQIAILVATYGLSAAEYFSYDTGHPLRLSSSLRDIPVFAGFVIAVLAATAFLPACSVREHFLVQTRLWWKRHGVFLAALPIAAGLIGWLVWLPVHVYLPIWSAGTLSDNQLRAGLSTIVGGPIGYALDLATFALLLGNWLEFRGPAEVEPALSL